MVDLLGAVLTLATILFLVLAGYLLALRLLGDEARRDPLGLTVAALTASISLALAIGLALGALGQLRIDLALSLLAAVSVVLLQRAKHEADPWGPAQLLARRTGAQLGAHPALALITLHAAGSELLRGLLRPPLSWDSLMYHLLLAARWMQDRNLAPVLGPTPVNFYGFQPGNGSLWLWWWLAPAHSELYVNLASALPWLLLGLAAGAVARELGAQDSWPLAAYVTLLTPTILRFVATQYVDIFAAAGLVAAAYFSLRWLDRPRLGTAFLAGAGLGIAAGTKVLALPSTLAWAAGLLLVAVWRRGWRVRAPQVVVAFVAASALGGFWYTRNLILGAGPLGLRCDAFSSGREAEEHRGITLPREGSPAAILGELIQNGELVDSFLGITRAPSLELGIGPQVFLLAPILVLPILMRRPRRDTALLIWSQLLAQAGFWMVVPYAYGHLIFANIRYLDSALALAVAAGLALLELRGVPRRGLTLLALALGVQSLLQLHAEMPRGVRLAMALADAAALCLLLWPRAATLVRSRWRQTSIATAAAVLATVPVLGAFRVADRARAMAFDLSVHSTPIAAYVGAWNWLDRFGADGTVDVVGWPQTEFVYPAMGARLERRAIFANVNSADHQNAAEYPRCDPRTEPSREAWLANLRRHQVRWLHLMRRGAEFAPEANWAATSPSLFALRYEDAGNQIYELIAQEPPG